MPASPFKENDAGITHQIIDRPSSQFKQVEGREYIQPQWVLDSFNEGRRLPIEGYLPDRICPPHLSPFVVDADEGYVPKQREILNKLAAAEDGISKNAGADAHANQIAIEEEEDAQEAKFMAELEAETKGVWASDYQERLKQGIMDGDDSDNDDSEDENEEEEGESEDEEMEATVVPQKKKTRAEIEAEEDLERRKAMMPKKHQRLFQRIEKGEKQKVDNATKLTQKRQKIETKKEGNKKKKASGKK